jgi:DNA-directed RNA polymerase sigma subunit (sigma70/sigma32)
MKNTETELDRLVRLWETRKPMSTTDLAKLFGVSRHKIQNIERRGIEKIKMVLECSK